MIFGKRPNFYLALEVVLLAVVVGAFLRSLAFIGHGIDPHHDFYAAAPGLFFFDGLRPNLDFYTHYGPADAVIKGILLNVIGPKLIGLRAAVWALELVALLLVCYSCELGGRSRCWLLASIGLWAISEPSGTGLRGVLYWHPMGWSSDIAVILICLLIVATYWAFRSRSSSRMSSAVSLIFNGIRGALIAFIFFTKFTIGLSMIAALIIGEVVYWLYGAPVLRHSPDPQAMESGKLAKVLAATTSILLGLVTGISLFVYLMGGLPGLAGFVDQAMRGQYEHFSAGSPFKSLFNGVVRGIVFNPNAALGFLIVLAVAGRSSPLTKAGLLALAAVFGMSLHAQHLVNLIKGNATAPTHIYALAFLILALLVVYTTLVLLRNFAVRPAHRPWPHRQIYCLSILPIGLFSLTQFYPILDPGHAWWSVGPSIPAAAFIVEEWVEKRAPWGEKKFLLWFASFNLLALAFTAWVLKTDIARNRYYPMAPASSRADFFAGIVTVDDRTAAVAASLRQLREANPKLIILDAGWTTLFDLFSSREALRARATCQIKPLQAVRPEQFPQLLQCLQQLRGEGWEVIIINNSNPKTKDRSFGKPWTAHWAIVSPGDVPALVIAAGKSGIRFSQQSQSAMTYWRLE